jgi:hypothetical protein
MSSDFTPLAEAFSDRRKDSPMPVLLELVKQVHDSQKALDVKLTAHMMNETGELAEAITKLMSEAFPAGDPDGHRRHHELVIQQAEERAKFWQEMRVAAAKWAGLAVLSFLVIAAWQQFLKGPQ